VIVVFINHDIVPIPIPVIDVTEVVGRNAEVEAVEPEAIGTASAKAPYVTRTEAAFESPMFPGMIIVKAGIVTAIVVTDPFAVPVDVRGLRVAFPVAEGGARGIIASLYLFALWLSLLVSTLISMPSPRTMARHVTTANITVTLLVVIVLRQTGQRKN
jgi:hypothetical protein